MNALQAARGKKTKAAEMLGVSRVTLWKWLKEFEVQVETVVPGTRVDYSELFNFLESLEIVQKTHGFFR